MLDVREMPDTLKIINAILNNQGIAEVKVERGNHVTVVEVKRTVKTPKPENNSREYAIESDRIKILEAAKSAKDFNGFVAYLESLVMNKK